MNVQVENLEKNMAKMTITLPAEDLINAMKASYQKQKNKFNIHGFRKGKAPMAMIEKMYGPEVFYDDAVSELVNSSYPDAMKESNLEIVSQPEIDAVTLEKGKDFVYTALVAVKPEVTLGQYKGIEVERIDVEVTEEEIMEHIDKERKENSRQISVDDRPVQDGDTVTIDYDGYVDGEQFEGGLGEDYDLVIGSHTFIDTFEDQLIGKNIGDETEVNVTFPEEYHSKEVAGKPAVFKVKIKNISFTEIPELDDDFVQEVSEEAETVEDYKEEVKKSILENKEEQAKGEKEDQIIEKIIEEAQMDIPEAMIKTQADQLVDEFAQRIQAQGVSLRQYLQMTGLTMAKFREQMKPQALQRIQSRLVLEAVVEAENIEIPKEDVDKQIEIMAEAYHISKEETEKLIGEVEYKNIRMDLAIQKAVEVLLEHSVEVEPKEKEEETEEKAEE